jgi:F0F1-type ATP synthase assembly protein I
MMQPTPPRRARWFVYTDAASVGIEIVLAVVVGALGGHYLERYVTHWSPWTTLIGLAIGVGAAVNAVVRAARGYRRQLAEKREQEVGDDE